MTLLIRNCFNSPLQLILQVLSCDYIIVFVAVVVILSCDLFRSSLPKFFCLFYWQFGELDYCFWLATHKFILWFLDFIISPKRLGFRIWWRKALGICGWFRLEIHSEIKLLLFR